MYLRHRDAARVASRRKKCCIAMQQKRIRGENRTSRPEAPSINGKHRHPPTPERPEDSRTFRISIKKEAKLDTRPLEK